MPTYPLAFPSGISPNQDKMELISTSAGYRSVYTGQAYFHAFPGQWWKRELGFPPLPREKAEVLVSFLCRLQGQVGPFTCGMFLNKTPRGSVSGPLPTVSSFSPDGTSLSITGGPANRSNYFLAGDFFGVNGYIFKALQNVSLNGSGAATFDVAAKANNSKVAINQSLVVNDPQGRWRLTTNNVSWSINDARLYGITIEMVEDL